MKLDLHFTDGTTQRVTVLDHRKLTLGDWRRLTPMVEEDILDATYTRASIFTGIPVDELSARVSVKGIGRIMEVVWGELGKAIALTGAFKADMAGTDDVPKPPRRIIIGGKKYRVPHDVEIECTFGQFVDWEAWRAPEHEADLCAEALAFMLVEDGKQYGGTDAAKVEAMRSATIADAFGMCVFFFREIARISARHRPAVPGVPHADSAGTHPHSEEFRTRYRGIGTLIEAAEVMPVIRAAFGERADVTEYPIFHVLEVLSYMRDRGRDGVWTSRKFQKLTAPPLPVKR